MNAPATLTDADGGAVDHVDGLALHDGLEAVDASLAQRQRLTHACTTHPVRHTVVSQG